MVLSSRCLVVWCVFSPTQSNMSVSDLFPNEGLQETNRVNIFVIGGHLAAHAAAKAQPAQQAIPKIPPPPHWAPQQ